MGRDRGFDVEWFLFESYLGGRGKQGEIGEGFLGMFPIFVSGR